MDAKELERLLTQAGCDAPVISHCRLVAEQARLIGTHIGSCNASLCFEGGFLHDIGRSRTHGIAHAVEGSRIASASGLSPELVHIVRTHIGAGLTADEAAAAGLPAEDFMPLSIEAKIVAHADTLADGDRFCSLADAVADLDAKGLHTAAARVKALHAELSALAGMDAEELLRRGMGA